MLVYCTILRLDSKADMDTAVGAIAAWLSKKTHENVNISSLKVTDARRMTDGSRIQSYASDNSFPILRAVRFTHSDRDISGRQWITEIGLRQNQDKSDIECSILLRTDEISTRVDTKISPTVPLVVHEIIKRCSPLPQTPGLAVKSLDNEAEVEAFGYAIDYPERKHPFLLVSPTNDGGYLVDIEKLRFWLEGLADVIQIPANADTFHLEKILGTQYAAWRGAVNIIFPAVRHDGRQFVPTKRFLPDELTEMKSEEQEPEREILSIIMHRTNLPNSWQHITPDMVIEQYRRRELARLQKQAVETGKSSEYIKFLEEYNKEQDRKIIDGKGKLDQLENEINSLEGELLEKDDELRRLKYDNESLKALLARAKSDTDSTAIPDVVREILLETACESFSPKVSLSVIARLFPKRIEVLENAWKSSEDSEKFKWKKKAFELLWKLATDYWIALSNGRGDTEARSVFGDSYSAKESETAESNKRAKQLRAFTYKGQEIEMVQHLKIGVKPSPVETIRIHFTWDASEQKIIIGYCGPHLDLR